MTMETAFSSLDQSISPYKQQIRNPKIRNRSLVSRPFEKFPHSKLRSAAAIHDGVLHAPPPPSLSFSYPPPVIHHQQPPLLPLPVFKPYGNSRSRGLSCPPINRKINHHNRTRDQSLTPKKSKPFVVIPMKSTATTKSSECVMIDSTNRMGPNPKDLPKDVSRVLFSSPSSPLGKSFDLQEFSGSAAFTLSPPPSSLPLPTFSLRPRLGCNAEAVGIDAGATDNLRRLLRLC